MTGEGVILNTPYWYIIYICAPSRDGFRGPRPPTKPVQFLFLANDRCLRDYDLVVVEHCFS